MEKPSNLLKAVSISGLLLACALVSWAMLPGDQIQISPTLSFQVIDGREIKLSDLRGSPVMVTFWATTCDTCVKKVPELKSLYQKFQPLGLEIIAVVMAYDPPNRILAFSRDQALPYAVALDVEGALAREFDDVELTPSTFLIDSRGNLVFDKTGDIEPGILEQKIVDLLNEQENKNGLAST